MDFSDFLVVLSLILVFAIFIFKKFYYGSSNNSNSNTNYYDFYDDNYDFDDDFDDD